MKNFSRLYFFLRVIFFTLGFFIFGNYALADNDFDKWLIQFKKEAVTKGISEKTLSYLDNLKPIKKTIELDRNQPEFKMTLEKYTSRLITNKRIAKGKNELSKNKKLLDKISKKYNVQKRFIIALWAIESDFGRNTGNYNTLQSLLTLSYDGRRSKYFRNELLLALKIIENGMVKNPKLIGSWAGAMGQCQFMPSSYLSFSQDWDNDGFKDIWGNKGDVFASIANYLKNVGWNSNYTWGRTVNIQNIKHNEIINNKKRLLSFWSKNGIKTINNNDLPNVEIYAKLINPDNNINLGYLVYDNFDALLKWNRSNHFAITVGLLADKINE